MTRYLFTIVGLFVGVSLSSYAQAQEAVIVVNCPQVDRTYVVVKIDRYTPEVRAFFSDQCITIVERRSQNLFLSSVPTRPCYCDTSQQCIAWNSTHRCGARTACK